MCKVLIVDDAADVREVMSAALSEKHEVRGVRSLAEAMALIQDYVPDVTFLDIRSSEGAGDALLVTLRNGRYKSVVVVITGGDADGDLRSRLIEHGALYVLQKPFDLAEVQSIMVRVEQYVRASKAHTARVGITGDLIARLQASRALVEDAHQRLMTHDIAG